MTPLQIFACIYAAFVLGFAGGWASRPTRYTLFTEAEAAAWRDAAKGMK